jgi:hypothetical protein
MFCLQVGCAGVASHCDLEEAYNLYATVQRKSTYTLSAMRTRVSCH